MYIKLGDIKGDVPEDTATDESGLYWLEGLEPGAYETTPKCFSDRRLARDPDALCGDELWTFSKSVDWTSPQLLLHAKSRNALPFPCEFCFSEQDPINRTVVPPLFSPEECYFIVKLERCFVKQYKITGANEVGKPQEEISLWFEKIHYAYDNYTAGWDNIQNVPWDGTSNGFLKRKAAKRTRPGHGP